MAQSVALTSDPQDPTLRALADEVRHRQKDNAESVYKELQLQGYHFPHPHDLRVAGDCGALLIKQDMVPDWPSAFALITAAGYRAMKTVLHQMVEAVHHSGGIVVIAHPGRELRHMASSPLL